jgi:hypothetical protein
MESRRLSNMKLTKNRWGTQMLRKGSLLIFNTLYFVYRIFFSISIPKYLPLLCDFRTLPSQLISYSVAFFYYPFGPHKYASSFTKVKIKVFRVGDPFTTWFLYPILRYNFSNLCEKIIYSHLHKVQIERETKRTIPCYASHLTSWTL